MGVDEPVARYATALPARPLRGRVRYDGYDVRGATPGVHRGLPSPYLTLIVTFDDVPVTTVGFDGVRRVRPTVLGGLHDTPITVPHQGRQAGIHVSLHPLAARAVLGMPAGPLAGVDVEASDVLGVVGGELAERVAHAPDWTARFAVLDEILARWVSDAPPPAPEMRGAWSGLLAGRRVAQVARDVGWSERRLTQRLRVEVGTTPKALARVARFHRARGRVLDRAATGRPLDLAGIAVSGGFADQAHLNREFRAFTGASPTRWLAEEGGLVL